MSDLSFPLARRCPSCGEVRHVPLVRLSAVPVLCHVPYDSPQAARDAPRGELQLVCCETCGLIFNASFAPALLRYQHGYDNAQHHSPRFANFLAELADELSQRYNLCGKSLVEVGCGDGFFLRRLCALNGACGVGIDPACDESSSGSDLVQFQAGTFTYDAQRPPVDLLCARHVLEHVPTPRNLLKDVRRSLASQGGVGYFEVPNTGLMIYGDGIWDLLYEHCLYFTEPSLESLFVRQGFTILDIRTTFDDHFLSVEACSASPSASISMRQVKVRKIVAQAKTFSKRCADLLRQWERQFASWNAARRRLVVWGAGTKGVTFLNLVPASRVVLGVVDISPRKHGRHVAGTGHPIVAPETLRDLQPDGVLVMNPVYLDEITTTLTALGIAADVIAVGGGPATAASSRAA